MLEAVGWGRGRGEEGASLEELKPRTHQLLSPRRGREGGVSSSVEGSCDRDWENNAKEKEGRAVRTRGERLGDKLQLNRKAKGD